MSDGQTADFEAREPLMTKKGAVTLVLILAALVALTANHSSSGAADHEAQHSSDAHAVDLGAQAEFRSRYDYLDSSEEAIQVAQDTVRSVENHSLEELGLALTDTEWNEFDRRVEVLHSSAALKEALADGPVTEGDARYGGLFGGLLQDHQDRGRLHLFVTDLKSVDLARLEAILPGGADDLRVFEVERSWDELRDLQSALSTLVQDYGVTHAKITIDRKANQVVVQTPDPSFELEGLRGVPSDAARLDRMPPGWIVGQQAGGPSAWHAKADLQSGLEIEVDGRCTWGLTGHNNTNNMIITTGHCFSNMPYGTTRTGYTDWQQDWGGPVRGTNRWFKAVVNEWADVARIKANNKADTNCYHSNNGHCYFRMLRRLNSNNVEVGQTICASLGASNSYPPCGVVTDPEANYLIGNDLYQDRIEVSGINVALGDSGAGGKFGSTIIGILELETGALTYWTNAWDAKQQLGDTTFDYNCKKTGSTWDACPVVTVAS